MGCIHQINAAASMDMRIDEPGRYGQRRRIQSGRPCGNAHVVGKADCFDDAMMNDDAARSEPLCWGENNAGVDD
jgi:hypothetical protein